MDDLIGTIGIVLSIFLVLSAAVEVIVESFRGTLELFGIETLKSKVPLGETLKLAEEFSSVANKDIKVQLKSIKSVAEKLSNISEDINDQIKKIDDDIKSEDITEMTQDTVDTVSTVLRSAAEDMKKSQEQKERNRIFILRLISAVIGCLLVYLSKIDVLGLITKGDGGIGFEDILIGGLAAGAGSSYWHDKLDKIRAVKSVATELKNISK